MAMSEYLAQSRRHTDMQIHQQMTKDNPSNPLNVKSLFHLNCIILNLWVQPQPLVKVN